MGVDLVDKAPSSGRPGTASTGPAGPVRDQRDEGLYMKLQRASHATMRLCVVRAAAAKRR